MYCGQVLLQLNSWPAMLGLLTCCCEGVLSPPDSLLPACCVCWRVLHASCCRLDPAASTLAWLALSRLVALRLLGWGARADFTAVLSRLYTHSCSFPVFPLPGCFLPSWLQHRQVGSPPQLICIAAPRAIPTAMQQTPSAAPLVCCCPPGKACFQRRHVPSILVTSLLARLGSAVLWEEHLQTPKEERQTDIYRFS